MKASVALRARIFFIRLFHWEYWPFHAIYLLIYPVWLLFALRARSFFFFAASNPRIRNGGFLCESKKQIYQLMPPDLQPRTIFFAAGTGPQEALAQLLGEDFRFPLIGKPDIGGRGRAVRRMDDEQSVLSYVAGVTLDFHIQEFISYENELGIFYCRMPGQETGKISGIVGKEFLKVQGDGKHSVRDLLMRNPRGLLQLPALEETRPDLLDQVIPSGQLFTVIPYGNHARGAKFLDLSPAYAAPLEPMIQAVCRRIPEFYFGRLDIRYRDRESLEAGKDFVIVELNGAGADPTHIYDPRHSIFFAWREIIRHWSILYRISVANHRRGFPYLSFQEGRRMFREDRYYSAQLTLMKKLE